LEANDGGTDISPKIATPEVSGPSVDNIGEIIHHVPIVP